MRVHAWCYDRQTTQRGCALPRYEAISHDLITPRSSPWYSCHVGMMLPTDLQWFGARQFQLRKNEYPGHTGCATSARCLDRNR